MAGRAPDALADAFAIECRLSREGPVDLTVSGRRLTAARRATVDGAPDDMAEARDLLRRIDSSRSVRNRIEGIHLEYDAVAGEETGVGAPGVYLQFALGDDDLRDIVLPSLRLLAGPPDLALVERVAGVLSALPDGARLRHLGIFPSRPGGRVRLSVQGLPLEEAGRYVARLGWAGDAGRLERVLRDVDAPRPGKLGCLQLDVGTSLGTRVGFEFAVNGRPHFGWELEALPFLDRLVARDLCTPARGAALLRWPGLALEPLPHRGVRAAMLRTVNHVKLAFDADGAIEAKAYLLLFCPWGQTMDPGRLVPSTYWAHVRRPNAGVGASA